MTLPSAAMQKQIRKDAAHSYAVFTLQMVREQIKASYTSLQQLHRALELGTVGCVERGNHVESELSHQETVRDV